MYPSLPVIYPSLASAHPSLQQPYSHQRSPSFPSTYPLCPLQRCSRSLRAGLLLLTWAGLSTQESADLTPFHGFLPQNKLRALLPPGDPHPNDIYHRSRPKPEPIPPGFEIKYPDYKFTFDIPKDPERPVYIITEKSTEPRATTRPVVAKTPSTPSLFDKLKKYPPEQYRVFPGGYARLSTYSSLSG
ncbi:hypothetical protein FJT64_022211 [Amphibalanus amphitrite]|uniref:Uncharacterized protein n=1 Tax=Amphibalanus amphitrite TaxID=1232801 RepID=A0A6A4WHP1_AMPAM|nr:hypothetical protein FJT64_022211 [Amphibalanus amphitrite]